MGQRRGYGREVMTIVEYFSFLPYGKYAFYIWVSYLMTFIVIGTMFMATKRMRKKAFRDLRIKFSREK